MGTSPAAAVALIRSELRPAGAVYTAQVVHVLGKGGAAFPGG